MAEERAPEGAGVDEEELDMATFSRALKRGAVFGIPATFVIAMFVMWIGPKEPEVWAAALWSAIVAGFFFGGVFSLNLAIGRIEKAHQADIRARREVRPPSSATPRAA